MKKRIISITLLLLILISLSPIITKAAEPVKLWINGKFVETDAEPILENGRTLVPIRVISENLGLEVEWSQEDQSVMIYKLIAGVPNFDDSLMLIIGDNKVIIPPSKAVEKNALFYELEIAPKIVNSRTFVPLRFIAEAYGLKVDWDSTNRTAVIGEGYTPTAKQVEPEKKEEPKPQPTNVSTEFKNALKKAQQYNDIMHMSKKGLYNQLTSQYGEKFLADAAQYAVDNVKADWKANALKKAESYATKMFMSKNGIYNQLISEYGEKFSPEEAQYAIDNIVHNWNANALEKAKSYQKNMSMSKEAIRKQLTSEYGEKFTQEEADWAIQHLD